MEVRRRQGRHVLFTQPDAPSAGGEVTIYYSPGATVLAGRERVFLRGGYNRWRHAKAFGPIEMTPPKEGFHFSVSGGSGWDQWGRGKMGTIKGSFVALVQLEPKVYWHFTNSPLPSLTFPRPPSPSPKMPTALTLCSATRLRGAPLTTVGAWTTACQSVVRVRTGSACGHGVEL
jgi:hypothetical protein